jgi:hypothetical protein
MQSTGKPSDYWKDMVPEHIREQFPNLMDTLDFLDKNPDSREAALSLFWMIYDLRERQLAPSQEMLDKLDNLERELNTELREQLRTGVKHTSKFLVYLHVAGSLVITLESRQITWEERVREILDQIQGFWRAGYNNGLGGFIKHDSFDESLCTLAAIIRVWLFKLKDHDHEWEDALHDLMWGLFGAVNVERCAPVVVDLDLINC